MKRKMVNSISELDLSKLQIPMIVIYDSPKDFPGMYLCRVWEGADSCPTNAYMQRNSLEEMRKDINAAGFNIRIPRDMKDDPVIIETWMK